MSIVDNEAVDHTRPVEVALGSTKSESITTAPSAVGYNPLPVCLELTVCGNLGNLGDLSDMDADTHRHLLTLERQASARDSTAAEWADGWSSRSPAQRELRGQT